MKKKSLLLGVIILALGMGATACNSKQGNNSNSSADDTAKVGKRGDTCIKKTPNRVFRGSFCFFAYSAASGAGFSAG